MRSQPTKVIRRNSNRKPKYFYEDLTNMDSAGLSRRRLLQIAAGAGIAALAACRSDSGDEVPTVDPGSSVEPVLDAVEGYTDDRKWEGKTLVVASSGDAESDYFDAQVRAIFEPFQRLTGAVVRTVRTDLGELRRQVNSAEVSWGVCDVAAAEVLPLANSAIIDEIDFDRVNADGLFEPFLMSHGVGANLHATVLAFHRDETTRAEEPVSWADFWDLSTFPGLRGFQETPVGTLEFALLSRGIDPEDLYPLDVDLAFRQLDAIFDQIALWWRQGAQPTQMIITGDLAMVASWHDRIVELASSGATIGLSWDQSQINGNSWVVPNGAPERDLAMDFVNFATRPEVTAAVSTLIPFGPANDAAFDLLETEDDVIYPGSPAIVDQQFVVDLDWWFKNREPVETRFQEWLAENQEQS